MKKKVWGVLLLGGVVYLTVAAMGHSRSTHKKTAPGKTEPKQNSNLQRAEARTSSPARAQVLARPGDVTTATTSVATTPGVSQYQRLASELDQGVVDADTFNQRTQDLANRLTLADAVELQKTAVDEKHTHNARFLAVYLLGQRAKDFANQLKTIALSQNQALNSNPKPHTFVELQKHFEEALRTQALQAVDTLNTAGPGNEGFFNQVVREHHDPIIGKLARMGAMGAKVGKPLINQYMNANF